MPEPRSQAGPQNPTCRFRRMATSPGSKRLALGIPHHPDEHRPQHPVLLAVDQELAEVPRGWVRRRALITAPKVNTVAANIKTPREMDSGTPDTPIRIHRIVPTRKLNQMANSSSEWRSVMSNSFGHSSRASSLVASECTGRTHALAAHRSASRNMPTSTARSVRSSSQSISSSAKARLSG
jgi:hypothetical protein